MCYLHRHPKNALQLPCGGWQRSTGSILGVGASAAMAECSSASFLWHREETRLALVSCPRCKGLAETLGKCSLLHRTVPSAAGPEHSLLSSAKAHPVQDSQGPLPQLQGCIATTMENCRAVKYYPRYYCYSALLENPQVGIWYMIFPTVSTVRFMQLCPHATIHRVQVTLAFKIP